MNSQHEPCYGKMYPDLSHAPLNIPIKGRVFTVLVESSGPGIQRRSMSIDHGQWNHCVNCRHYRECYDLSLAKLCLQRALQTF